MEICSSQIFVFLSTIDMLDIITKLILYFSIILLVYQTRDRRTMCSTNIHALLHSFFHQFSCFLIIYQFIALMIIHLLLYFKHTWVLSFLLQKAGTHFLKYKMLL